MNNFGWLAKDNTGTVWEDKYFPEYPGGPTHWVSFVNLLENEGRWLELFSLRHKHQWYSMMPNADRYAFHYNVEVEIGAHGNVSRTYAIGTAVTGKTAVIREVSEDGSTTFIPAKTKDLLLMRPSPLHELAK